MRALIRFTLQREVLVNLVFIIFMVMGAFSLTEIPVDRFPNFSMGKVYVETVYPGAAPEEVEALITDKIEEALDNLPDVEFIRSASYRQRSTVVVKFIDDSDYEAGYRELRFRVLGILDELPEGVDPPRFNHIDVNDWLPVLSLNLMGARSNRALTLMAKEMKIPLRQVPGVKEVMLRGEQVSEFHVRLDPDKLTRHGVTFDQVARALSLAGISVPAGDFSGEAGEFVVQADERFRNRSQVVQAIVRTDADGSFVRVSDLITSAGLDYRDPFVLSSVNGDPCVTLQIIKTPAGNSLAIKEAVLAELERFKPMLEREKVKLVITRDTTVNINNAMTTLGSNLLLGVALVWLVIFYFTGWRNAVITTVGIPFSFLLTMLIMYLTGNSLNEITLFSFVLVSGIIVDDAVVVVENIYRHVQEGDDLTRAIVEGTSEVALPVVAATATTVAAFLPMLVMTGSTGEFFALVPKAVAFAILASLFECLVILPSHFRDWGPKKGAGHFDAAAEDFRGENLVMRLVRRVSLAVLGWTMRHRAVSLLLLLATFISAVGVAVVSFTGRLPLIQVKFFPDDYSLYYVLVDGPSGMGLERTGGIIKRIERFVMADGPGMAVSAKGYAGFYPSEDYEPVFGYHLGHVAVTLPPRTERHLADYPDNEPQAHLDRMYQRLQQFAVNGVRIRVRPEKDGPPAGKDLNLRVVGPNPTAVDGLSREMWSYLKSDERLKDGLTSLTDSRGRPDRVVRFKVRAERAAEFGVDPAAVVRLAAAVMNGRYVGKYRLADEEVDLKLRLDPALVKEPGDALLVPLVEHPSGPLRLGDLTQSLVYMDPGQLDRYQGERAVTISANIRAASGLALPEVAARIDARYAQVAGRFPGATIAFGGEYESTRKSFTSLAYAFIIALGIMYLILATQFSSYSQPLIILSTVAFSLIGVIYGKLFTQSLFTINSFVATVGLAGVVVNDALVLIDFINKRYATGLSRAEAVRQAVHIRLRPILLTTVTTTLGLLPMAIGIPYYSVIWGTMAATFVTGLCTATFLTIVLVPVQWDIIAGWSERRRKRKAESEKADA